MYPFTELPRFKYRDGDWVKERGFPEHHLRIMYFFESDDGRRLYMTYDTTLKRGYSDYELRDANQLEANSDLVQHADNDMHLQYILARCQASQHIKYSIPGRTDCESLQRFIQTGDEADRWCPQLWKYIAIAAVGAFFFSVINQNSKRRA
jgi:hypothetical protein